ncbi:MAG: hypothetical protein ACFHHU_18770 [Porticoccaceae bacterium]
MSFPRACKSGGGVTTGVGVGAGDVTGGGVVVVVGFATTIVVVIALLVASPSERVKLTGAVRVSRRTCRVLGKQPHAQLPAHWLELSLNSG